MPGTAGMTLESSLLATPAGDLFFVAGGQLFKVPVADAQTPDATFGTAAQHRRREREPGREPDARSTST